MFKQAVHNSSQGEWWKSSDASETMWHKTNDSTNMSGNWAMVMFRETEESLHESMLCCGVDIIKITQAICNVYVISSINGATWEKLLRADF